MTALATTTPRAPDHPGDAARRQLMELLDGRLDHASAAERTRMLLHVTMLFLRQRDHANATTLAMFDEIFIRLIDGRDIEFLAALSTALAPLGEAPPRTVARLARHPAAAVAAPVLSLAGALTPLDLAAVAQAGCEDHLRAIASRACVDPSLSAILVARGVAQAIDELLVNPGASFSIADFRGRIAARQRGQPQPRRAAPAGDHSRHGGPTHRPRRHTRYFAGRCKNTDRSRHATFRQVCG